MGTVCTDHVLLIGERQRNRLVDEEDVKSKGVSFCVCFVLFHFKMGHLKACLHTDTNSKKGHVGSAICSCISHLQYKIYKRILANKNSEI